MAEKESHLPTCNLRGGETVRSIQQPSIGQSERRAWLEICIRLELMKWTGVQDFMLRLGK